MGITKLGHMFEFFHFSAKKCIQNCTGNGLMLLKETTFLLIKIKRFGRDVFSKMIFECTLRHGMRRLSQYYMFLYKCFDYVFGTFVSDVSFRNVTLQVFPESFPTQFPDLPSYICGPPTTYRVCLEQKRMRRECAAIDQVITDIFKEHEYEKTKSFSSFEECGGGGGGQ
ncbi:hypothetical protein R5R35_009195 [Gryllus longicercus]|uniref:Uncharacterized protein n=1 Tax=Gryllus longicercus TaxID=2509291 RepID=A0AAN9V0H4_9ORTH